MSRRVRNARFLLGLGTFIQSLPVVVMNPDDLIEFSRRSYEKPGDVDSWAEDPFVDSGLTEDEKALIDAAPTRSGKLLLLGAGGGREAIPFTQMGFEVTGVDFIPGSVERLIENGRKRGLTIHGLTQEISQLSVSKDNYDIVWISRDMYSCIPNRSRRVAMVQRIHDALKPGGYFLCQYHLNPAMYPSPRGIKLRRLIAILTLGNYQYEPGDCLWQNIEFLHAFSSEEQVRSEIEAGGLRAECFPANKSPSRKAVICVKPVE